MSAANKPKSKVTTVLPDDMYSEVQQIADETMVGLADLLRQGVIRLIKERRETGTVVLEKFAPSNVAAKAA